MTGNAPHVARAPHFEGGRKVVARMEAAVRGPHAPHWLGQVANGVWDVAVDTLADAPEPAAAPVDRRRADLRRAARLLGMFHAELDTWLEEGARTGSLIRLALHTTSGAAQCLTVVPDQHQVGFRLIADVGQETDRVMIDLVERLRSDQALSSQTVGGDPAAQPQIPVDGTVALHRTGGPDAAGRPAVWELPGRSPVHWIGLVDGTRLVGSSDRLADPGLEQYFALITPEARRKFYAELAVESGELLARARRMVHPVLPGALHTAVFDVEQGVLVLHQVGLHEVLVGVTLDQRQVAVVERELAVLAGALRSAR